MSETNTLIPFEQLESMSRRDRKKQETRWRIYDAAIKLMTERGYHNVKIEEICTEADVSNPAFFNHFTNKAALMRAYLDRLQLHILTLLNDATEASNEEKLRIISREISQPAQDGAAFIAQLFSVFAESGGKLNWDNVGTGLTGMVTSIIQQGQKDGEFKKQWQAKVLAVSLCGSWFVLPMASIDPNFPDEPYTELLDFMLDGLRVE